MVPIVQRSRQLSTHQTLGQTLSVRSLQQWRMAQRRQVLVRLTEQAYQTLAEAAQRQGRSRTAVIESLVLRHLGGVERTSIQEISQWLTRNASRRK